MDTQELFSMIKDTAGSYREILTTQILYLYEVIYSVPIFSILQSNVAIISVTLYLLWYVIAYLSKTELISMKGSWMTQMVEKMPSFHSGYVPTIWCFPAAINTIIFSVIQQCILHKYEREILKTQDGGQIAIDWANKKGNRRMVLLVLPGLTGCSKDNYVSHFVEKAVKMDCKAVVMNYRGIECDLLTARTYCATNLEDLHMVVEHIQSLYPDHRLFAIGISLGGIKLGSYLAKQYDDCFIKNAMIVSVPYNVFASAEELEKSQNLFFNKFMTKNISRYFARYQHLFQNDKKYDMKAISRCQSLRELDTHFTSKQFGYESLEAYYSEACLDSKLQDIKTQTLFLNAADDMFSPSRVFPIEKFNSNPNVALVLTKYGGHISFVEGMWPTGCNYACRLFKDYLSQVIAEVDAMPLESPKPKTKVLFE